MNPEVALIVAGGRGVADPPVVKGANQACKDRGWSFRIHREATVVNSAGTPVCLLDPEEARRLYLRAHRSRLAVWTTADVMVRIHPTRHRLDERYLVPAARLFRYKASFRRISPENLEQVVADFGDWTERTECTHERDPRVLPLHSFCPSGDWEDLDSQRGRKRFMQAHGGPADRTCEQDLHWKPDLGRDGGRDPQQVAGLELSLGYHWDVSGDRGRKKVLALTEVWQLDAGNHLNIYPNGHVRGGENSKVVATVRAGSKRGRGRSKK